MVDVMIWIKLHTATYIALQSVPEETDHKLKLKERREKNQGREMFCDNQSRKQAICTI
jgi:hypothetical protein